jgi:hypothetical protein
MGALLTEACKDAGFRRVEINHEVPKRENIKAKPTISCYLYHLSYAPDYRERNQNLVTTHDDQGHIVSYYRDSPLYLMAHYMVAVFGHNAKEEALLMGLAMKTFLEYPLLTGKQLKGDAFYPDDRLNVYPNPGIQYEDVLSFWRAMNEEARPSVHYQIKFRLESQRISGPARKVETPELKLKPIHQHEMEE